MSKPKIIQNVEVLEQKALLSMGDNNADANTIIDGITRNTNASTNYPSTYGVMATMNSNEGSGNYILQLHAGTSTGSLHYRTGADNKISKAWTRVATGEEIDHCVKDLAVYKSSGAERNPDVILDALFLSQHENNPTNAFWYIRNYFYGGTEVNRPRTQVAIPYRYGNQPMYVRSFDGTTWTAWARMGGTEQASLAFVNGWSASSSFGYTQAERAGNIVSLNMVLNAGTTGGNMTIGTIPVGYRPKKLMIVRCAYYNADKLCNLVIEPNGTIRTSSAIPPTTAGEIILNVSYVVA